MALKLLNTNLDKLIRRGSRFGRLAQAFIDFLYRGPVYGRTQIVMPAGNVTLEATDTGTTLVITGGNGAIGSIITLPMPAQDLRFGVRNAGSGNLTIKSENGNQTLMRGGNLAHGNEAYASGNLAAALELVALNVGNTTVPSYKYDVLTLTSVTPTLS